jgi:hypothetical protein
MASANAEAYNKYVAQVRAMPEAKIAQKWRFSTHRKPFEPDPDDTGVGKRRVFPFQNSGKPWPYAAAFFIRAADKIT